MTCSNKQLADRFELWLMANGYNEALARASGGRITYANPAIELAWQAVEALHGSRIGPDAPDNDLVICPNCTSQFRAIPVNVQRVINVERQRLVSLADRWSKKGRCEEADEVYARINAIDLAMNTQSSEEQRNCRCSTYCMKAVGMRATPEPRCRGLPGERPPVKSDPLT